MLGLTSAASAATQDQQLWLQTTANVKLSDQWRLSDEVNVRFGNAKNGLYEVENNLLLSYRPSAKLSIGAGYTHDPQYTGGHFTVMEQRAREQASFDDVGKLLSGSISLRLRAEQRWRDGIGGTGWRLRPFIRYALPLTKGATLVLWNESFINLNGTGFQAQTGFDRMRNTAFVRIPLGKQVNTEIGYLNQYSVVRGGTDKMDHAATLALNLSL